MSSAACKTRTVEPVTRALSHPARKLAKPTILIVEDHDDTREMLGMFFKMWGCRGVEAWNGLEAVAAASRERPEIIVMDGSLPYLDGLGATRRIRENQLLNKVKIIALNGWGDPSYHADALAAGCDDCLDKPLDFDQLENYMSNAFIGHASV